MLWVLQGRMMGTLCSIISAPQQHPSLLVSGGAAGPVLPTLLVWWLTPCVAPSSPAQECIG